MSYDYKNGKQRVQNILNSKVEVIKKDSIPTSEANWTFDNGIKSWVGAIFVDLRNSASLFRNASEIKVAKVIRAYTSEVIQIMNMTTLDREIGVRGDAVYGVFSVNTKEAVHEILNIVFYINTYMNMLNKLLVNKEYGEIKAGIGYAISEDLIIKAGKKGTGINDRVWIGSALAEADRLSKITNKSNGYSQRTKPIGITQLTYNNVKHISNNSKLFEYSSTHKCYLSDAVKTNFNNWIKGGMR